MKALGLHVDRFGWPDPTHAHHAGVQGTFLVEASIAVHIGEVQPIRPECQADHRTVSVALVNDKPSFLGRVQTHIR
jgi:hypothetical protein